MMQEFVQEMNNYVKRAIQGIHTAMPGTILSFDPATCRATVQPGMKFKKPDGTTMDYPQISGVPVAVSQGSGNNAAVAFPIKAGDGCILIIGEQSLDYWMYGQETDTDLAFDLTNAMCIPGLSAAGSPAMAQACSENCVVMTSGGTTVKLKDSAVEIDAPDVQIKGNLVVQGSLTHG